MDDIFLSACMCEMWASGGACTVTQIVLKFLEKNENKRWFNTSSDITLTSLTLTLSHRGLIGENLN